MSLNYETSSEPLHIFKQLFLNWCMVAAGWLLLLDILEQVRSYERGTLVVKDHSFERGTPVTLDSLRADATSTSLNR